MSVTPMHQLSSRIPEHPARASVRVDPFWGGLWEKSTAVSWSTRDALEAQARVGVASAPAPFLVPADDPVELLQRHWVTKLRVVSALDSYRTATTDQLTALTGSKNLLNPNNRIVSQLFAHRLVDVGEPPSAFTRKSQSGIRFLRPSNGGRKLRERWLNRYLTYPEWVRATGARPWIFGGQSTRHDSLGLELLLRSAEWNRQVSAVAGEKYCSAEEVLFTSWGVPWPLAKSSRAKADGMLVRKDGLRILIELTATTHSLDEKAKRWAKALAEGSVETQGTVVVFVLASRPSTRGGGDTFGLVAGAIRRAVAAHPGRSDAPTRDRLLVADWARWFPEPDMVDEEFLQLKAWRTSKDAVPQNYDSCEPVELSSWECDLPAGARGMPHTLAGLYASPFWMQEQYRGVEIQRRRASTMFDLDSPVLQPPVPNGGAVPPAGTPVRLRG